MTGSKTTIGLAKDGTAFSSWINSSILDELRPHNVMRPFFKDEGPIIHQTWEIPFLEKKGRPWDWSRML